MKKILLYISSLKRGGAERVMATIAQYLAKSYEVVLATDRIESDEFKITDAIHRVNIEEQIKGQKNRRLQSLSRICALRRLYQNEKPDIVLSFMAASGMRMTFALLFTSAKHVMAIRSNPEYILKERVRGPVLRYCLRRAKGIVFQMDSQKEMFETSVQNKSTVIFNPVNEAFLDIKSPDIRSNQIVTVGRLFDYKNHKMLIKAFADISKKFPDMTLIIYGEGPYRQQTEAYIKELSLTNKVFLPGSNEHVAENIKDAALFVLTSDTEGMPNTLIEAMVLGIPVISTDCPCGGPRTLIHNKENGILVPVGDEKALAQAMTDVLSNHAYAKKLSENAKKLLKLVEHDSICGRWEQYLKEVCKK